MSITKGGGGRRTIRFRGTNEFRTVTSGNCKTPKEAKFAPDTYQEMRLMNEIKEAVIYMGRAPVEALFCPDLYGSQKTPGTLGMSENQALRATENARLRRERKRLGIPETWINSLFSK